MDIFLQEVDGWCLSIRINSNKSTNNELSSSLFNRMCAQPGGGVFPCHASSTTYQSVFNLSEYSIILQWGDFAGEEVQTTKVDGIRLLIDISGLYIIDPLCTI